MSAERDTLAADIAACRRCPGLNVKGVTGSAPGYGSETSPVMLVGQSLCKPCMFTGVPFTGGSGRFIEAALRAAGRVKSDLFVTNVVHCHPPDNRRSKPSEIAHCAEYLHREMALVRPRLIVGLGVDAHTALRTEYPHAPVAEWRPFTPPPVPPTEGPVLLCLKHPSHVKFWPAPKRQEWVASLAAALSWGFSAVPPGPPITATSPETKTAPPPLKWLPQPSVIHGNCQVPSEKAGLVVFAICHGGGCLSSRKAAHGLPDAITNH